MSRPRRALVACLAASLLLPLQALSASSDAMTPAHDARRPGAAPVADLLVASVAPGAGAMVGDRLEVDLTVRNSGRRAAPATTARLMLSTDRRVGGDRTLGSTVRIPALRPGRSTRVTARPPVPATQATGTYWVVACADAGGRVRERDERNCRLSSQPVTLRAATAARSVLRYSSTEVVEDPRGPSTTRRSTEGVLSLSFVGVQHDPGWALGADSTFEGTSHYRSETTRGGCTYLDTVQAHTSTTIEGRGVVARLDTRGSRDLLLSDYLSVGGSGTGSSESCDRGPLTEDRPNEVLNTPPCHPTGQPDGHYRLAPVPGEARTYRIDCTVDTTEQLPSGETRRVSTSVTGTVHLPAAKAAR